MLPGGAADALVDGLMLRVAVGAVLAAGGGTKTWAGLSTGDGNVALTFGRAATVVDMAAAAKATGAVASLLLAG
jgi:ABC-type Fe3+ transport system substrate-binding protein